MAQLGKGKLNYRCPRHSTTKNLDIDMFFTMRNRYLQLSAASTENRRRCPGKMEMIRFRYKAMHQRFTTCSSTLIKLRAV